jgi:transposase
VLVGCREGRQSTGTAKGRCVRAMEECIPIFACEDRSATNNLQRRIEMHLKTILNRVEKHRFFVYGSARLVEDGDRLTLEIDIHARANSNPFCSGCMRRRPAYDRLGVRRFEFVPLWGIAVFFLYMMRRVKCRTCGIVVEAVPWATGKRRVTTSYAWFLARWAKRMSWTDVADAFRTSWDNVFRSVEMAVAWGRAHVNLDGILSIGVDELAWQHGQKYMTAVYQIDEGNRRLLWIGPSRKIKTLLRFFRWFGQERTSKLRFICSDMWRPYLRVIAKKAGHALHILDRFHIMSHFSKAIDEVRATEARGLKERGVEVLKGSRWSLLKRPENMTPHQEVKLAELLRHNLKTIRSYLMKEEFQIFWTYRSPFWASVFLDWWTRYVMRSRIEPMKRIARMLRRHRQLIFNWFAAKGTISAGAVEGLNNKAKLITRKAYGYRSLRIAEIALYHGLGKLPEPNWLHRFC